MFLSIKSIYFQYEYLKNENPIWPRQIPTWFVDSGSAYIAIWTTQNVF